jgi:RNA polymerase sigma-70 factor (ECF subfamily)
MTEQLVIAELRRGDTRVLESLYSDHKEEFTSWLRKDLHIGREEALEFFQEAVVILYENVTSGKLTVLTSSVKTYLFSIGRNKALAWLKKQGRQVPAAQWLEGVEDIADESARLKEEQLTLMERCLQALGDPCCTILDLFYFQGLTVERIARQLDYASPGSLKSQKFKCMERLRALYFQA